MANVRGTMVNRGLGYSRRFWRFVASFASIGFLLPLAIYALGQTSAGAQLEETTLTGLIFTICPTYMFSISFEHATSIRRLETVAIMALFNAILYFAVALFVGVAYEALRRKKAS